mmetsp:Transcript_45053/g.112104  ORF Transcript_45053/g.112104 Transcript_45053/m.112104 type:complete len:115 (-) Transcript_45053:951-1295(-)
MSDRCDSPYGQVLKHLVDSAKPAPQLSSVELGKKFAPFPSSIMLFNHHPPIHTNTSAHFKNSHNSLPSQRRTVCVENLHEEREAEASRSLSDSSFSSVMRLAGSRLFSSWKRSL